MTHTSDSTYLDARVALQRRYSTYPQPWHEWAFEPFDLLPQACLSTQ